MSVRRAYSVPRKSLEDMEPTTSVMKRCVWATRSEPIGELVWSKHLLGRLYLVTTSLFRTVDFIGGRERYAKRILRVSVDRCVVMPWSQRMVQGRMHHCRGRFMMGVSCLV